jgi:predicted DNA-binding transcriptional regulator AlpA
MAARGDMSQTLRDAMRPAAIGLNRLEAARYVGVSATTFDQLVNDGRMPRPARVGMRRIWDRRRLDLAFEALQPEDDTAIDPNEWDDVL